MGLEKNNGAVFLTIADGKIKKRVKQPTKDSVQRTTKQGTVVHEETYDGISGMLVDIKVHVHDEFGAFWNIYLKDGEDIYCVQTNYSGGYASAFLKQLPNVDLKSKIRLSPTMKMEGTKKKVGLFINQNGKALKHFYTKDNPNGLPQMVQRKKAGKLVWEDTDMMDFLENMVTTEIRPQLPGFNRKEETVEIETVAAEVEDSNDKDSMPF